MNTDQDQDQVLVSIVTGTLNRLEQLQHMIDSVNGESLRDSYEFIVVDGGSTDGTAEWLATQPGIHYIQQGAALGAVKAFNAGFLAARGTFVVNLNDDCIVRAPVIPRAIAQLKCGYHGGGAKVGQIAIPFTAPGQDKPQTLSIRLGTASWPYANFGVTWRWLGNQLGWWGDQYFQYGGDTELSMKIWKAGYHIEPLKGTTKGTGYIEHFETMDDTRKFDPTDMKKFLDAWNNYE